LDPCETIGMIEVGLEYSIEQCKLYVDLMRVVGLPSTMSAGDASPFHALCNLMPDNISKELKALSTTVNPIYRDVLDFDLDYIHLDTHFIQVFVFDKNDKSPSSKPLPVAQTQFYLNSLNIETAKRVLVKELQSPQSQVSLLRAHQVSCPHHSVASLA
jgi:hypothetical protein